MKRTVTVKLQPSKAQEKALSELALISSKVWNKVNYLRRKEFFEGKPIDFNKTEKIVYEEFKSEIGSATVQQIARKNAESWRSFFSLLRNKRNGELPKWFKPKPPNYIKEGGLIILRNDQYKIEGNKLILKGLGKFRRLEVQFKGRIHLKGKQGRLEITFDPVKRKWYAHISYTVEEKLINGKWVKLPREPLGNLSAGIDLGVNNLMAVYVENGESFLVNGRPLKSIDFYWQKRIAEYQSKLNKSGAKKSKKLSRMHQKAKLQAKHYINTMVRQTVEKLYHLGVSRIIVGYPKGIARNSDRGRKQNYLLSHVWRFNTVIKRLKEVAEEYGIQVLVVNEAFTSKTCPVCGKPHDGARFVRGLFKCPATGLIFNADLVGAFNILRKAVKTITPSLSALSGGRGNWPETRPEGSKTRFKLGLNETPQTSPPMVRG
ncbi:probable transposase [Thermococcus kodakarensis KOD1]|uniref:Probable transposase n=1 Tax=Thermococcus kodakarensis (strain ATCC BAA-918 / JCM 12380 / KOD1) TaxID=69014 RepID=Q5JI04_THEKO|nr:RNA-guided endonuclease TnpB family protein [Thermococcus kodakarensis]WCN28854.1 transposase [Thermococcus kodakarensis]WCN31156.1 transposase [Thermococcus kodakarensis]BAD85039.1 probable transposase [Thermococcus kodakarensis KOD1]